MIKNKSHQKYLIFLILLFLISCIKSRRPDVSQIDISVQIQRFDKDFSDSSIRDLQALNNDLSKKYGAFYQDYMTKIIGNPALPPTLILEKVRADKDFKTLNNEVAKIFQSMDAYENELNQSFKYLKYYYPKTKAPKFYTFISGFDIQLPLGDNYMGIGLDMFMGANNPFYKKIAMSVPRYISRRFTPQYIVPRIVEGYIREDILPDNSEEASQTMLDQMIYNGKLTYLLQSVLPENTPDSVLFGYTPNQMKWAENYQKDIWSFFISNKLLFETDFLKFRKYIDEAPFTNGLGKESAPKLGVYIGYQIVKRYIANHPKDSLAKLLNEKNAQQILNQSKYKP